MLDVRAGNHSLRGTPRAASEFWILNLSEHRQPLLAFVVRRNIDAMRNDGGAVGRSDEIAALGTAMLQSKASAVGTLTSAAVKLQRRFLFRRTILL